MSQHCKGLCDKDKRFKVSSPYCHTHGKYCSVCTKKVKTNEIRCPCCRTVLRVRTQVRIREVKRI